MGGSCTWRFNCNQIFMDWGKYPRHIHKNYIVHKFKCRFCIKQFWDSDGYKKVNHDSFGLYLGLSWYVAWTHITICQKHGFKSVVEDNPLCPHTGQKKQNIFVSLHLFWSELWLKLMLSDPSMKTWKQVKIFWFYNQKNEYYKSLFAQKKRQYYWSARYLCGSRSHFLQRVIVCKSFIYGNKLLSQTRAKTFW